MDGVLSVFQSLQRPLELYNHSLPTLRTTKYSIIHHGLGLQEKDNHHSQVLVHEHQREENQFHIWQRTSPLQHMMSLCSCRYRTRCLAATLRGYRRRCTCTLETWSGL